MKRRAGARRREARRLAPLLVRVGKLPHFMTFSDVIGLRIGSGRSLSALRMLVSIGASPKIANDIVEDWPTAATRLAAVLSIELEAACRLAMFVDRIEKYDWRLKLKSALLASLLPIRETSG